MIEIELNNAEQKLVETISLARSQYDRKHKRKDQLRADKSKARFIEVNGLGGEIAVAKAFNLYPDINTEDISRYDCLLPDGRKLEVKTTEYGHGKLIVRKKNDSDLYILVTGKMPNYKIIGYIEAEELDKYWTELEKGFSYVVEQKLLKPIEDLITKRYSRILVAENYHKASSRPRASRRSKS